LNIFNKKFGFTVLELLLVVSIFAIVMAFAIPKFQDSLNYTDLAKTKADILLIRTTIKENKNNKLLTNKTAKYDDKLDDIFKTLDIGDEWSIKSSSQYELNIQDKTIEFLYDKDSGQFDCLHTKLELCEKLTR